MWGRRTSPRCQLRTGRLEPVWNQICPSTALLIRSTGRPRSPNRRLASGCRDERPGGLGYAPAACARRPTGALGRLPELPAQLAHRLAGDGQAVAFAELLGQMRVVEAAVARGHEADHR